jgi:hypothetical protein
VKLCEDIPINLLVVCRTANMQYLELSNISQRWFCQNMSLSLSPIIYFLFAQRPPYSWLVVGTQELAERVHITLIVLESDANRSDVKLS